MGLLDKILGRQSSQEGQSRPFSASSGSSAQVFSALTSADLYDFMRGSETASGEYVTTSKALGNMSLLRCVSLISECVGMLPLNMLERGDEKAHAETHPVYSLLKKRPNDYQSAYKFKSTMQLHVLLHGNAYARVIRSNGRVIRLIILDPKNVTPKLTDQFTVVYEVRKKDGGLLTLPFDDVLHLSDLSEDGLIGLSRVEKAKESIGLALQAEKAAARLFKNGVLAGGALTFPQGVKLSEQARKNIADSLEMKYSGAEVAHKWMVLEDGVKPEKWTNSSSEAQHLEQRNHQIEEIARAFGVPRPLLMMDDTSWGSGIEQLGMFFVQYGLQHWFTVWEDGLLSTLLTEKERDLYYFKFNERALMRGTLKDQADFFAKALGSGGHMPWMVSNEVRNLQDLPKSDEPLADSLESPMMRTKTNEPSKTA